MRSAWIIRRIRLLAYIRVPVLPVAVESAVAMDVHIVATKDEGGRLVLIADWHRVVKPVLDVGAPLG